MGQLPTFPFHSVPSQWRAQDKSSFSHPTVAKSPSLLYQAPSGTSTSAQPNTANSNGKRWLFKGHIDDLRNLHHLAQNENSCEKSLTFCVLHSRIYLSRYCQTRLKEPSIDPKMWLISGLLTQLNYNLKLTFGGLNGQFLNTGSLQHLSSGLTVIHFQFSQVPID